MTDVNLVKVLEERVDQGNNNHSIEDTYFKKIEELLSVKNKEMEDKLNQQHEQFTRQLNEINKAKTNNEQDSNNGTKVSAFKQQLLDIKNNKLKKDRNNIGNEMTSRSTTRSKRIESKELDVNSNSVHHIDDVHTVVTPIVDVKNLANKTKTTHTNSLNINKLNMDKLNHNDQLEKETIQLSDANDNFKDESPNLSAIINMDENFDDGSIEIERKRLSAKLTKKDREQLSKKSLAMKDITAYKNSKRFKEDNHTDVVKQMQKRQSDITNML